MLFEFPKLMLSRRGTIAIALILLWANVASAQRAPAPPPKPGAELGAMDLEQLMRIEVVVAGSKRAQSAREVPSFVSVVTAAEIKEHGYRTLGDALKALPSFYVSNDRNYSFVGVRGFGRPGDYNSRVLVLLNGLRTNGNLFDEAYVGEEFVVDVDLIDRIEVIRGPSAALYGSNAFFAVINVVTKQGRGLQGGEVATTAASFGTFAGRASYGREFANDLDVLVSASYTDGKGQNLYFPEFDAPSTNGGIANGADREGSRRLFATASKGDFSFQASNVSREKGIPTASYGTLFNDRRSRTVDGLSLASLSYNRSFSRGASISTRLHAGRSTYVGRYAYDASFAPNQDNYVGEWWGADVDASRVLFSRHVLTVGAEFRDNFVQNLKNYDPEPYVLYSDVRDNSIRWGMFAQDEVKLFEPLTLYAGVRLDQYATFGSATSPRVGLIYAPGTATTVKLLAGRAFRAPNEAELSFQPSTVPRLQPERIETLELIAQRFIGGGMHVSASMFRNRLSALIAQIPDPADTLFAFENADEIQSEGIELGLEVNRGHGVTGLLSYSLQETEDRATGVELTNSPRHMAKLQLRAPLNLRNATAGLDAQYVSARRTLAGNSARRYLVTNLSLLAPHTFGRFDLSATIYNLFDVKYGAPGSDEHVQDILQQDGRNFRVKTTLHF